jgi:ketosteroid isomerase-like protein
MSSKSEDIDALKQLLADWHAGWLASDTDALLGLFADDPVLMPQN